MPNMTQDELYEIRRQYAKENNTSRFTISALSPRNGEYSKNKDRDGLSKNKRAEIEAVKDRQTYGNDDFSEVWE